MKKILIYSFIASLFTVTACNSERTKAGNSKNDSLAAARAADSMLREALAADTLKKDSLKHVDTLPHKDSLKK